MILRLGGYGIGRMWPSGYRRGLAHIKRWHAAWVWPWIRRGSAGHRAEP